MKVLVATQKPFAAVAVNGIRDILEKAGHEVVLLEKYESQSDLVAAVSDVQAMIVRSDKVTAEVIAAAPELKIVVRAGAGYDNVDLASATLKGVVVMNTPGQNSNAVAELAVALMIFMARNQFNPSTGTELEGKTFGSHAFGHIGALVCKKAAALGMNVKAVGHNPAVPDRIIAAGVSPASSVKELYSTCDYVAINVPATSETVGTIGYDLISSMPKGATLINTARKEVINEEGLKKALEERQDIKYATDVAPDNYEALKEAFGARVFATPKKMGAQTSEANINAGLAAARQIAAYFDTGCTQFQVNK